MSSDPEDIDRKILEAPRAVWSEDSELNLTEPELDELIRCFGAFEESREPQLRSKLKGLFRTFIGMAIAERYREIDGGLERPPKPSTIVVRDMERIRTACENFEKQLESLDDLTKTWFDQHLKEIGAKDGSNQRLRLRNIKERIFEPMDYIFNAAHASEGIASRGQNNAAVRAMIENLAVYWETYHGQPPTTDKGRGQRPDPFLAACQKMAGVAHARLKAKGVGLGTLQLSGLVARVLKTRQRSVAASQDKLPEEPGKTSP